MVPSGRGTSGRASSPPERDEPVIQLDLLGRQGPVVQPGLLDLGVQRRAVDGGPDQEVRVLGPVRPQGRPLPGGRERRPVGLAVAEQGDAVALGVQGWGVRQSSRGNSRLYFCDRDARTATARAATLLAASWAATSRSWR